MKIDPAFRPRRCLQCGERFDPAARSSNPANAARMIYCSKACCKAAWYRRHREEILASQRTYFRERYYPAHAARLVRADRRRRQSRG
jgi:hypothetical protein